MPSDVSRLPPGGLEAIDAQQGWAMVSHPPAGPTERPVDLLFLHGIAAGGWMWPRAWLDRFASAGYRTWTVTLPGRPSGGTMTRDTAVIDRAMSMALQGRAEAAIDALSAALPGASLFDGPDLGDFTDVLAQAIAGVGRPVVAVCHSLGGAVAQNLMRRGGGAAGTVLLCSVPPYGTWRRSAEMAVTDRALWRAMFGFTLFGAAGTDLDVMRDRLFPAGIGDAAFAEILANLRDESLAATSQAGGFPPFAPFPGPRADVMVIGGARDPLVPPLDIGLTGFYYGQAARIVPGAGHLPMHEPAAGTVAQAILDWLDDRHPAEIEAAA